MARTKQPEVFVTRFTMKGKDPLFISMAQRHLEKEMPTGTMVGTGESFIIPADILRLSVPDLYVDEIEEVRLVYKRKSSN